MSKKQKHGPFKNKFVCPLANNGRQPLKLMMVQLQVRILSLFCSYQATIGSAVKGSINRLSNNGQAYD